MTNIAIRQATFTPLGAMLVPIAIGLFVPGYSVLSQQMSELEMYATLPNVATRVAAIVSGLSIALFGMGLLLRYPRESRFTMLAAVIFGVSMIGNGVFTMGSPWHGLYGIGLFDMLVPAFFAAEIAAPRGLKSLTTASMAVSVVCLVYNWSMIVHLDPPGLQGLTQRIFSVIAFGWYSLASLAISQVDDRVVMRH
ncbi:DUF998 domain-containing protein [Dyella jejuensis]|uniref:DUF998 domain-containing protein n=1 Tax=Dyella jejuensis TaxID=1432009 RepID=A0ABW8JDA3_9GAMM